MSTVISNRDVLLFIPNLIGYARVIASLLSFVLMIFSPEQWSTAIILYLGSFTFDLFDGMAARKFDQCSEFGGLLDMITDRCSTLGLFFVLYGEYGSESRDDYFQLYRILFMMLAILDISSHWCQMYASASLQLHHKSTANNSDRFFLVRFYYQCYPFFGYCCVSAELTYVTMYVLGHATIDGNGKLFIDTITFLLLCCVPGCAIKQIVNVSQLLTSTNAVATSDANVKNKQS